MNENLSFKNYSVIKDESNYEIRSLDSNDDFSKIFISYYDKISVIDTFKNIKLNTFNLDTKMFCSTLSSKNSNFMMCSNAKNLFSLDLRNKDIMILNRKYFDDFAYSLQFHPINDNLLLIASHKKRGHTFDIRNFKSTFYYNILESNSLYHELYSTCYPWYFNKIYAKYNKNEDKILTKKNNLILFESKNPFPIFEFMEYGYYNSLVEYVFDLTIISNFCFAGIVNEFVVSSSNNFDIYFWRIPEKHYFSNSHDKRVIKKINTAKSILKVHRSIVNQVCYNYENSILASSSIEKSVKLWSIFPVENSSKLDKNSF